MNSALATDTVCVPARCIQSTSTIQTRTQDTRAKHDCAQHVAQFTKAMTAHAEQFAAMLHTDALVE